MENIIIKGFLKEFASNYSLENLKEDEQFEHFVNYCLVRRIATNDFEIESINVGKEGNPGIDGLALLINERVVSSKKDIDYFVSSFGQIEVEFAFVQSKTSSKFELGEILKFISAVKNCFFGDDEKISFNDDMMDLIDIKNYIYEKAADLKAAPKLSLFYSTTGNWKDPADLVKLIHQELDSLRELSLFSEVEFYPIDASKLQQYYKDIRNRSEKEIDFRDHTILPQIDTISEAYLGIVSSKEYIKLITDEEEYLLKSIFYDNVRDYQGNNPVNNEISATVNSIQDQNKFCILNNGVTIVAKSLSKIGTKFILRGFQIVNGCQTSHILYEHRDIIGDELFVPIKIIVTTDTETTNKIIQATNRQTEVKTEAFESLKPFHKELEDFYLSLKDSQKIPIYYERRSKQYTGEKIANDQIVTLTRQIKSFIAIFLNEPHSVSRYYGELLTSYSRKIFQSDHSKYPYYVSALVAFHLDRYFRRKGKRLINKRLKPHLLMILRIQTCGVDLPPLVGKNIDKQCKSLIDLVKDDSRFEQFVDKSIEILHQKTELHKDKKRNLHQIKVLTKDILEVFENNASSEFPESKKSIINYYNPERGFGFIKHSPEDLFFHISNVDFSYRESLRKGAKATYFIETDDSGTQHLTVESVEF